MHDTRTKYVDIHPNICLFPFIFLVPWWGQIQTDKLFSVWTFSEAQQGYASLLDGVDIRPIKLLKAFHIKDSKIQRVYCHMQSKAMTFLLWKVRVGRFVVTAVASSLCVWMIFVLWFSFLPLRWCPCSHLIDMKEDVAAVSAKHPLSYTTSPHPLVCTHPAHYRLPHTHIASPLSVLYLSSHQWNRFLL